MRRWTSVTHCASAPPALATPDDRERLPSNGNHNFRSAAPTRCFGKHALRTTACPQLPPWRPLTPQTPFYHYRCGQKVQDNRQDQKKTFGHNRCGQKVQDEQQCQKQPLAATGADKMSNTNGKARNSLRPQHVRTKNSSESQGTFSATTAEYEHRR